jgi:TRAP-type C4-dicarboxylate transport system permease small subunit
MGFIGVVYRKINQVTIFLIVVFMTLMVVNISLGVFFRYVLNNSLTWTEELGRYFMIWAGFLGMSLALKEDLHVGVFLFLGRLPPKTQRIVVFIDDLVVMCFSVIVFIFSIKHLMVVKIQISPAVGIPMYLPYSAVTVGTFLMTLQAIRHLFTRKMN